MVVINYDHIWHKFASQIHWTNRWFFISRKPVVVSTYGWIQLFFPAIRVARALIFVVFIWNCNWFDARLSSSNRTRFCVSAQYCTMYTLCAECRVWTTYVCFIIFCSLNLNKLKMRTPRTIERSPISLCSTISCFLRHCPGESSIVSKKHTRK